MNEPTNICPVCQGEFAYANNIFGERLSGAQFHLAYHQLEQLDLGEYVQADPALREQRTEQLKQAVIKDQHQEDGK